MSMKPRHAAALAFVGWYLMVPPASDWKRLHERFGVTPGYYTHGEPFYSAPLLKWEKLGEFYLQADCESTRDFIVRRDGISGRPLRPGQSMPDAKQYQASHATCIAADDSRLRGK
jgi:hypothetical protein